MGLFPLNPPKFVDPEILLIYSSQKMGKTDIMMELTRQYPEVACLIPLEPGEGHFAGVYPTEPVMKKTMTVWEKIKVLQTWLKKIREANNPYKILIWDNLTILDEWSEWWGTYMYQETNAGKTFNTWTAQDVSNPKYKKYKVVVGERKPIAEWESVLDGLGRYGYRWSREAFYYWIDEFLKCADYHIFVSHVKEIYEEGNELATRADVIDLTGKVKTHTARLVSSMGILYAKGNERWISFEPVNDNIKGGAGSRCTNLRNRHIKMSSLDKDGVLTYLNWSEIYTFLKDIKK